MKFRTLVADLSQELQGLPTIDAHEHLRPEAVHLAEPRDFYTLFQHYCETDLIAAGASRHTLAFLRDRSHTLRERWTCFAPFFERIRTGSYARAALIAMDDLLGIAELNESTYSEVSRKMQALAQPGLYDQILRRRCNIVACIQNVALDSGPYPDYFYHLAPAGRVIDVTTPEELADFAKFVQKPVENLDALLDGMSEVVGQWRQNPKIVGIKSGHAYQRAIGYIKRGRDDADRLFTKLLRGAPGSAPLSADEQTTLQDFLMYELVARAEAQRLPLVIHTGLQAYEYCRITDAHPLHLYPLLREFPRARFDLFHGGMPWVREIATLAKNFPNVYLNMCWMHIISPAQARSALSEWLDMVPNHKIFGFGGDYTIVEKVYGHLKIARENIAQILAEKITQKIYSRATATMLMRRLMFDNPREFYGLE